jgi:hypothetical protein
MSDRSHNERLLNDILAEQGLAGFRGLLLDHTLRLARRRRHLRQARVVSLSVALFLGLLALVRYWPAPTTSFPTSSTPDLVVRTSPLGPVAFVQTHPLHPANLVASSSPADILSTASAGFRAREINDEELLELAAPNPVVLVRYGSHQAELVFANFAGTE